MQLHALYRIIHEPLGVKAKVGTAILCVADIHFTTFICGACTWNCALSRWSQVVPSSTNYLKVYIPCTVVSPFRPGNPARFGQGPYAPLRRPHGKHTTTAAATSTSSTTSTALLSPPQVPSSFLLLQSLHTTHCTSAVSRSRLRLFASNRQPTFPTLLLSPAGPKSCPPTNPCVQHGFHATTPRHGASLPLQASSMPTACSRR